VLGGDLGGGYFPGVQPRSNWTAGWRWPAALGTATALAGGWLPARQAERLSPAQALKGLGGSDTRALSPGPGLVLLAAGAGLALLPPLGGVPLAAYLSVAALLFGGVALVPAVVPACCRATGGDGTRWCCWPAGARFTSAPRPARPWPAWWPAWR
jgi:putative ABC transport system permease protein